MPVKSIVVATPTEAVEAFLRWDGWAMTGKVEPATRTRSLQAAIDMKMSPEEASSLTADAFLAYEDIEIGPILKGKLDFSPSQGAVYATQSQTIETYAALVEVAHGLDKRIDNLDVAASHAVVRGNLGRSREYANAVAQLLTASIRINVLIVLAGGCWFLGNAG